MTLRVRLALWYVGLAAVVLALMTFVAYVAHGRALYDDLDHELAADSAHFAPLVALGEAGPADASIAPSAEAAASAVRLLDAGGQPLATPAASVVGDASAVAPSSAPPLTGTDVPALARASVSDSPYPGALGWRGTSWLARGRPEPAGRYTTVEEGSRRVRVYVLPVEQQSVVVGFVEAWAPLQRIDGSVEDFRSLLLELALGGIALIAVAGYVVSGPALRPLQALRQTANTIARGHDFTQRVPPSASRGHDDVAALARAFNAMLDALEAAHTTQRRFAANAAHELRAPLAIIRGNLELLANVPDMPPADRQEALEALHQDAERLSRLVEDLLELAASDAGRTIHRLPVRLDEIVMRAVRELQTLPAGGRVSLGAVRTTVVEGDADRLEQLVSILLDNAWKHTRADESIEVSLTVTEAAGAAEVVLCVVDHGDGIPPDDLPHVFERFFRARTARSRDAGGTGLGLAIAQTVARGHGGEISIESEPGEGTTTTVRLPLSEQ